LVQIFKSIDLHDQEQKCEKIKGFYPSLNEFKTLFVCPPEIKEKPIFIKEKSICVGEPKEELKEEPLESFTEHLLNIFSHNKPFIALMKNVFSSELTIE